MASFREELQGKLERKDFADGYQSWCEACPATMELVARVHAEGLATAELSRLCGIEEALLVALLDAEHCVFDVVEKLCARYGLEAPSACPRGAITDKAHKPRKE